MYKYRVLMTKGEMVIDADNVNVGPNGVEFRRRDGTASVLAGFVSASDIRAFELIGETNGDKDERQEARDSIEEARVRAGAVRGS